MEIDFAAYQSLGTKNRIKFVVMADKSSLPLDRPFLADDDDVIS